MAKERKTEEPTAAEAQAAEQAAAAKVDVCQKCEMRGQGGSYVFNSETGKRTRKSGGKP